MAHTSLHLRQPVHTFSILHLSLFLARLPHTLCKFVNFNKPPVSSVSHWKTSNNLNRLGRKEKQPSIRCNQFRSFIKLLTKRGFSTSCEVRKWGRRTEVHRNNYVSEQEFGNTQCEKYNLCAVTSGQSKCIHFSSWCCKIYSQTRKKWTNEPHLKRTSFNGNISQYVFFVNLF